MGNVLRYIGQAVFYALFAVFIGYFASAPAYVHVAADQAVVKVSFSHGGQPVKPCRQRSKEELERLPPNMRTPMECVRERSPVEFEFELDGQKIYSVSAPPRGLSRDGASTLYRRLTVPAGEHRLSARLKDSVLIDKPNYQHAETVMLKPGQIFVVDFDARHGGFVFK
jgi:hypothetical protein